MTFMIEELLLLLSEKPLKKKKLFCYLSNRYPFLNKNEIRDSVEILTSIEFINDVFTAYRYALRYDTKGDKFIKHFLSKKGFNLITIEGVIENMECEEKRVKRVIQEDYYRYYQHYNRWAIINFLIARQFSIKNIRKAMESFN